MHSQDDGPDHQTACDHDSGGEESKIAPWEIVEHENLLILCPYKAGSVGSRHSGEQIGACFRRETFGTPFVVKDRRPIMTQLREKAQGQTKQIVGQIVGDDQLVQEGKEQVRHAEKEAEKEKESKGDRPKPQR
jgi:uncharacterized protein YjbJ (UPF0337 family)